MGVARAPASVAMPLFVAVSKAMMALMSVIWMLDSMLSGDDSSAPGSSPLASPPRLDRPPPGLRIPPSNPSAAVVRSVMTDPPAPPVPAKAPRGSSRLRPEVAAESWTAGADTWMSGSGGATGVTAMTLAPTRATPAALKGRRAGSMSISSEGLGCLGGFSTVTRVQQYLRAT
jgi:hypothetical protein